MSFGSRFLAYLYKLPRRKCRARRTADIRIPMSDGIELATLLYEPVNPGPHPTILMR